MRDMLVSSMCIHPYIFYISTCISICICIFLYIRTYVHILRSIYIYIYIYINRYRLNRSNIEQAEKWELAQRFLNLHNDSAPFIAAAYCADSQVFSFYLVVSSCQIIVSFRFKIIILSVVIFISYYHSFLVIISFLSFLVLLLVISYYH
jgi:hypothetical protein